MNTKIRTSLIIAAVFQFLILIGMYVKAAIPFWAGQEIKVKTIPVDPRSLFRGNYARLRYDFNTVDSKYFSSDEKLRTGEVVYISLIQDKGGLYEFSNVSLEEPTGGLFLRGRVNNARYDKREIKSYTVNYGIDAFFAPKEDALALEKDLRDGGIAVLMVGNDGRARIKDVVSE